MVFIAIALAAVALAFLLSKRFHNAVSNACARPTPVMWSVFVIILSLEASFYTYRFIN